MPVNIINGGLEFDATINDNQFEAALQRIENQLRQLTQTANQEASAIENVASKASLALGSYLSLNAAQNFISEIVNVRGQYEQLSVSFRTMLGNKEKADALMAQAVQLAATTPFSLLDVATGAKQLLAYGTAAEKIPDTLKTLGNVAAGVSAPLGDIVYLYGTLQTQGRAYTRDILQFTSRGIPIIGELAKQFNVSTSEVQNLVEAGKVGFPEVQKAFQSMTGAGGIFFNLMEEQSKTVTGQISNLGDSFNNMLNEIGKSNEGIIVDSIAGLKSLIDNYQTVIDTIKLLVATYGAYKAAVIATAAYNTIAAEAVAGYTLVEQLRYRAMLLSEAAMSLLNKTMLANPYVAVATGIAALVSAYFIFRDETNKVKTSQELLADAQKDVGDKLAETEAKIRPYLDALKSANVSERERVDIYNKLKTIDPDIIKGLDAKTISYQNLTSNVNKYLDSLRNQLALESNKSAITESIKAEQAIQKQIDEVNSKPLLNKALKDNALTDLGSQLKQQQAVTESLGKSQLDLSKTTDQAVVAQKRTVDVIDSQIAEQKKLQTSVSDTSAEWKKYQQQIEALQKERESITGPSQKQLKEQQSEESKINTILNERQGILDKLASLQRDAKQSGLLQDQSQIDKIREKYDAAFQSIDEYNKKVAEFNQKNKTNVQGIGLTDVDALRKTENIEIANTISKQESEAYIKSLDDKKKAFEDFEKIQQQGIDEQTDYAKASYREQLGDFTSYLDFLKSQASDLKFKIELEPDNIGYQNSLLAVNKAINEESNKQQAAILQQRIADYASALQSAATFADKKKQIEAKYNKDVLAIAANGNDKQIADRLAILKQDRDNAIDAAKDEVYQKTAIYKRLSEDVVQFTKAQLKAQIAAIQDVLKQTKNISPEVKAQLQKQLGDFTIELHLGSSQAFREDLANRKKEIESELANNSDKLSADQLKAYAEQLARINQLQKENKDIGFGASAADFQKFAGYAKAGADGLRSISTELKDINPQLAEAISGVADLGDGLSNALSGAAAIASGDVAGAISSITTAISGAIKYFGDVAKSAKDSKKDLQDYQNSLITGETAYNELLRDRARTQGDIADLTIKELQAREDMLALQKQQAQADYNKLLQQIQDTGKQITGEHSEKTGGLSGALQYGIAGALFGKKTKTVQDLAGIGTADYAELEKLFTEGKLDDATKEWFTQLKSVHDELDSIGESADQVADQLNQALTGTTADSITDDIVKGFADGKRASADFADDFQSLMQNAILQSLKYNALQQPLQDFYKQFADDVGSDNALTDSEITSLQNTYSGIIDNASKQFEQLQNITKVDFSQSASSSSSNSLQGAVKNITEESAQLLAGQVGGVRLNQVQIMQIATQQLNQLILITNYAADIPNMKAILADMQNRGIKIRA